MSRDGEGGDRGLKQSSSTRGDDGVLRDGDGGSDGSGEGESDDGVSRDGSGDGGGDVDDGRSVDWRLFLFRYSRRSLDCSGCLTLRSVVTAAAAATTATASVRSSSSYASRIQRSPSHIYRK